MSLRLPTSDVKIPRSATSAAVAFSGLAAFLLMLMILKAWQPFDQIALAMLSVMAATACGVFVPDMLFQRIYRLALTRANPDYSWSRSATKLIGLFAAVGLIGLAYQVFPEYHGSFYTPYWALLTYIAIPWLLLAGPYVFWLDARMAEPNDGLWHLGRLCLGKWQDANRQMALTVIMGWVVKGFFLPLMFVYACNDLQHFLRLDMQLIDSFKLFFDFLFFFLFFIDVGIVSMGYLCTSRLLDTHIRSVEPTTLGWLAAIVCYEPFWSLIGRQYLAYGNQYPWGAWLQGSPFLYVVWGSLILGLVFVYVWATVSFGARFSNLTHRGIITHGPYRWTKHPAYLAKNLSWWMIAVPFLPNGEPWHAVSACILLLMLNGIYWVRARTEEAHLMRDPQYQAYAAWIARHGLFATLNRHLGSAKP